MQRISSLFYFLFVSFLIVNFSCTKIDNTSLGANLLPAVDNVNTFDTVINVVANNVDSVATDCFTVLPDDLHSLGYIGNNPLFGTTQSIIYTEIKPSRFPFSFPANRTLDSIVLVLSYQSTFGDTTIPQKVNVYQIANTFKPDSSSCKFYDYSPLLLGSAIYTPSQLNDSVKGFKEASNRQLRIRLDDNFGQAFLSKDSSNAFKTDSTFKDFLKGFAVVPDVTFGGNALSYFSLADTNTKLSVYFKSTNNSKTDTSVFNLRLNSLTASANYVARNHAAAEIAEHLANPPEGDDAIYIQTRPGTFATIKIPGLQNLSNRIINRATLTMDQVYANNTFNNFFSTPSVLFLDIDTSTTGKGYRPVPCDFTTPSGKPDIGSFGGFRTIVKDPFGNSISRYTFNISRYLQKIVTNGHANSGLRLKAPDIISNSTGYFDECGQGVSPFFYLINVPTFGQVKLGGGNASNYKMKLTVVYSNL